jgi:hypothetical protein
MVIIPLVKRRQLKPAVRRRSPTIALVVVVRGGGSICDSDIVTGSSLTRTSGAFSLPLVRARRERPEAASEVIAASPTGSAAVGGSGGVVNGGPSKRMISCDEDAMGSSSSSGAVTARAAGAPFTRRADTSYARLPSSPVNAHSYRMEQVGYTLTLYPFARASAAVRPGLWVVQVHPARPNRRTTSRDPSWASTRVQVRRGDTRPPAPPRARAGRAESPSRVSGRRRGAPAARRAGRAEGTPARLRPRSPRTP